jgi:hypothetical protein
VKSSFNNNILYKGGFSVLDWDLDARIVSPSSSLPTVEVIFIKPQNSNLL